MRKIGMVLAVMALITMAWSEYVAADNVHQTVTNTATGGAATATGGSSTGGTHIQTNTQTTVVAPVQNNIQTQGQSQNQGQQQGQAQGQRQRIDDSANNAGNTQKIEAAQPVGIAIAPGLTAAGTGVCLGSVSIGLSGPMAGASFGITKVDKGCERRSGAALLYGMGYKDAAIRLLSNDPEIKEALNPTTPGATSSVAPNLHTFVPVSRDADPQR